MIYTVTFNPALDYVLYLENPLEDRNTNRSNKEEIYCGGKGINVSVVLKALGTNSVALGFIAGFTGAQIQTALNEQGICTDFITLEEGCSRINIKLKGQQETEINAQGPKISQKAILKLYEKLDQLQDGDTLILAGSIPASLPTDIYEKILERFAGKNIRVIVDATKQLLLNVLKYNPFLIKPNVQELEELFGVKLNTAEDIVQYATKLRKMGAKNVLVSRAGDGAVLVTEHDEVYTIGVPDGTVVNSVGAGDSMVAGFLAGFLKTGDYQEALKLGTAAGSATAFSKGLAEKEVIEKLLKTL